MRQPYSSVTGENSRETRKSGRGPKGKPKPKSFGAIVGTPAPAAPSAAASGAAEKKAEKAARCAALASAGTRKAENEAFMADCPGAHYHLLEYIVKSQPSP